MNDNTEQKNNARAVQHRRGTAAQNDDFTGLPGEITIDLDNKSIRVHDGTTPGGTMLARQSTLDAADYVVAWQTPTAENNYTWYRKYKSGWVEQGGISQSQNVTLAVTMQDDKYAIHLTGGCETTNNNIFLHGVRNVTTTGFTTQCNILNSSGGSAAANNHQKYWTVMGFHA